MSEGKKNKSNIFFRILFVLFILFLCLYSIGVNGYLEKSNKDRTLYTEEQIKQFEKDVENGRLMDINEYILPDEINYSNASSNLGEKISNLIDFSANKSIGALNSFFSFLFN